METSFLRYIDTRKWIMIKLLEICPLQIGNTNKICPLQKSYIITKGDINKNIKPYNEDLFKRKKKLKSLKSRNIVC